MIMVQKYYVFLSVLFVFAYGSNSDITTNEVVYDTSSEISASEDVTDINLKDENSLSDSSTQIFDTTEVELTTSEIEVPTTEYPTETTSTTGLTTSSGYTSNDPDTSTEVYPTTEYPTETTTELTTSSGYTSNDPDTSTEVYPTTEQTELTTVTEYPTETTTIIKCESAELTIKKMKSMPFSLNISWSNSVNQENCDFTYKINATSFSYSTKEQFVVIPYLNACENYEGTISIIYRENSIRTEKFHATTSEAVDPVERIQFVEMKPTMTISWLPTIRTESCIKFYKWIHYQDGELIEEKIDINITYISFPTPDGCLENTFSVIAAIHEFFTSIAQNITYMDIIKNDPPIFHSANLNTHSATINWTFPKICKPDSFLVKFSADDEHFTEIEKEIVDQKKKEITVEINGLLPFTNYSFKGAIRNEKGLSDWSDITILQTKEAEPDAPENLQLMQFQNYTLHISWQNPARWNGIEIGYILIIEFLNLNYTLFPSCSNISHERIQLPLEPNINDYFYYNIEPASWYTITISAQSSGGIGRSSGNNIITIEGVPQRPTLISQKFNEYSIKNTYNVTLEIYWRTPCQVNGIINHYYIQFINCDNNDNDEQFIIPISSSTQDYNYVFRNLLPDACYNVILQLHLEYNYSEVEFSVTSPAGIPDIVEAVEDVPKPNGTHDNPETTANVYISNNLFNTNMGEIIYYAIIVAQAGCEELPTSNLYSLDNWPKVVGNYVCSDENKAYQATPLKWNPFKRSRRTNITEVFVLGTDENCNTDICNHPLTPNTNYSIKIRGFTRKGFSDTQLIYFNTARFIDNFQLGLILGLIFGILAIAFIIAAALFYSKGKLNFTGWPRMESTSNISPAPLPVPLKKFKTHYAKMIENSGKIKNEFQLLSTISSDVTLSTKTAMLPINRKKNRYINILPYDQTRVKLTDTSITASDYINASYIKGYSEYNEYIATQGPTESTSTAFWQMIIEQNVKLIIMLTQFIESGKEKCYKYFPSLNDTQNYLNVIRVVCTEEVLLQNYNRRTFKVIKGKEIKVVTHLQFNLWPDFGVPRDLGNIIEFSKAIKDVKVKKPYFIAMHCSAGVGRTGTLIAVDILMQTIRDKRKVDIFGTVLNLRKQRMSMVQSEVQYEFLYRCVNYLLTDNSRIINSSRAHSKIQLDQIEENQITTESNMSETFKL